MHVAGCWLPQEAVAPDPEHWLVARLESVKTYPVLHVYKAVEGKKPPFVTVTKPLPGFVRGVWHWTAARHAAHVHS